MRTTAFWPLLGFAGCLTKDFLWCMRTVLICTISIQKHAMGMCYQEIVWSSNLQNPVSKSTAFRLITKEITITITITSFLPFIYYYYYYTVTCNLYYYYYILLLYPMSGLNQCKSTKFLYSIHYSQLSSKAAFTRLRFKSIYVHRN